MQVIFSNASPSSARWAKWSRSATALPVTTCCRSARRSAPTLPTRPASNPSALRSKLATSSARAKLRKVADVLAGKSFIVVRSAGETGQLYGSVAARDVVEILAAEGFNIGRNQVHLNTPIKAIGLHNVAIALHAEVEITVELNVARSAEEAERQSKGEMLTSADAIYGVDEDALRPEDFFDPEADGNAEDEA